MMYRKSSPRIQLSNADLRLQRRVLLAACVVLLAAVVALGIFTVRGASYQDRVKTQFSQRMYSASASAVDEVNKLGSIVTSNASARLARVRQYIYYMEQLNAMSTSLTGNQLAPNDAFTALYGDLESFESLLQQSTTPTLDARSLLLTHLQALQTYLNQ
ncbi:MAG: hypothetical protein Q4G00_08890 [Clostridia bacterium]|nr:hypothetical protein [Clostridia bacterium]